MSKRSPSAGKNGSRICMPALSYSKNVPAFIGASSRGATRQATAIASAKKATPSLFFTGHRPS